MSPDWISRASARYPMFLEVLGKRSGAYLFEIGYEDGSVRIPVPASPLLAGRTAQLSTNASYNRPAVAFDLHLALGWVAAVFSNSAGRGVYGLRHDAWNFGMDKDGKLTGFDPNGYLCQAGRSAEDSLVQWIRFVAGGEEILPPEAFGKVTGRFPLLERKLSTRWMKSARLRWNVTDDQLEFRIEDGFVDSQPTMLDSLALILLIEGAKTKLLEQDGLERADVLLSVDEAKRAHRSIRRNGPLRSIVNWRSRDCDPREVICEEIIPAAIEGLQIKGVARSFSESLFDLLKAQISGSELKTGSAWFRRRSTSAGENAAIAELAQQQRLQPLSLDGVLQGVAHW